MNDPNHTNAMLKSLIREGLQVSEALADENRIWKAVARKAIEGCGQRVFISTEELNQYHAEAHLMRNEKSDGGMWVYAPGYGEDEDGEEE